jgi:lipopolysaccharide export LptBFGC system permease protein LptF
MSNFEIFLNWLSKNICFAPFIIILMFLVLVVILEFIIYLVRAITGNYPPEKLEKDLGNDNE